MLDTYRSVETPEGVELGLQVAGPAVRAYAWSIDLAIRILIYVGLSIPLAFLGNIGVGLYLLVIFVVEWFYPVYFEVRRDGSTPGKKRLGIRVLNDDGTPVRWAPSLIRNLLRVADFLPAAYGFGLMAMLLNRDFKRLGDLAAGTLVVYRQEERRAAEVPEASPLPPGVPLALDEQRAVLEFAERQKTWTPQRAAEIATLARPLTGKTGHQSHAALLSMANYLLGRR